MNKKMMVLVTSLNASELITEIIINRIGIYTESLIELAYTQLIICIVKSILELRYFPIML